MRKFLGLVPILVLPRMPADSTKLRPLQAGILYRDGLGVDKDYKQAVIWFERAAEASSQEELGSFVRDVYDWCNLSKWGGWS